MRKIFWSLALLSSYVWIVTTGNEQWVFDQGKKAYRMIYAWFNDAEVDFQMQRSSHASPNSHDPELRKKRSRRWD